MKLRSLPLRLGLILMFSTAHSEPNPLPAIPPGVRVTTLDNGLTLILREDHSAPVVSAQAWCKAGSVHEGKWLGAGLSHVLEHMLFKGTTNRAPGKIDQEVQDAGGNMNAYTSFDRTVYHIDVPNTGARVAIDILCDIVQNATLPAEELVKEKQVILREMDMNQDDPRQRSARRLFECAYTRSPYRFTVIGYPDIFNEVQREDVFAYYKEKYAPNDLFFVVVGDLQAAEVEAQIKEAFAKAKARALPPVVLPDEPAQVAPREIIEEGSTELAHCHVSWHIPDVRHADVPLLDVLATLLGGGRSSRLWQEVREKQALVNSVDAWTYSPGMPGLFGMSAMANADKFEAARDAMFAQVERMKQEPVSDAELSKAVKQFISATLSMRKTMAGQAQDLGASWLAANDLSFSERYLAAVKRVRPADLQRVARAYLTAENRTLYAYLPVGTKPKQVETSDRFTARPIEKFDLKNGLRLLVKEDHRLPFVEFRAVFQGGVLAEDRTNNGLTLLMAKMLLQGTKTRSAEQIAREMESLGGSIDSYGGNNSFGVNAEVLSGDFAAGLELVSDVILAPAFPGDAFERERNIQLAAIKAQRDQLLQSASRFMRRGLYGDRGYGLDVNGTEETVSALNVANLQRLHQSFAIPNNCVLAVFGDVDTKQVRAAVEERLGAWKAAAAVKLTNSEPAVHEVKRVGEQRDKKQAVLVIGFAGTTIYDADHYPLEILQEVCSDLGSRLFVRIRENLGLAYYVGAQNFLGLAPGYFGFYAGTEPEKIGQVETEMLKEAALLRASGVTEEELKRAKAKIVGQKKISRQDLGTWAMTAALDELYGLGFAHSDEDDARYAAVTLEQVRRVAQQYLKPDAVVISVVKP
ncbi:MAG: insulinase family protein [Verrucomicrobia bacterium]|nr:insulinase family protein [Verrucomicrobiota bacterium]